MKRALIGALALALAVPAGASAQDEPLVVCTRIDLGDIRESTVSQEPLLLGAPDDGDCDVVVYLPAAILNPVLAGRLLESAGWVDALYDVIEDAASDPPPSEAPPSEGPMTCADLLVAVITSDDDDAKWVAAGEVIEQCSFSCDELLELSERDNVNAVTTSGLREVWELRCQ